jgi:hypothetical protein
MAALFAGVAEYWCSAEVPAVPDDAAGLRAANARLREALAVRDARIAEEDAVIAVLQEQLAEALSQVADLAARVALNSPNSNKPSSSDELAKLAPTLGGNLLLSVRCRQMRVPISGGRRSRVGPTADATSTSARSVLRLPWSAWPGGPSTRHPASTTTKFTRSLAQSSNMRLNCGRVGRPSGI